MMELYHLTVAAESKSRLADMCRVTMSGVDQCTYSDVTQYGCPTLREKEKAHKAFPSWSLPIRPTLRREEAFHAKAETPPNTQEDTGDNVDKKE